MMDGVEGSGIDFSYGAGLDDFVATKDKKAGLEGGIGEG